MTQRIGLWTHLLLVAAVGILVASASIVYLVHRETSQVYAQELTQTVDHTAQVLAYNLEAVYVSEGLAGVRADLPALAKYFNGRIVILSGSGSTLLDSAPGTPFTPGAIRASFPLVAASGQHVTGYLIVPNPMSDLFGPLDRRIARALFLPAFLGFLGAMLLSLLLLRRIATPLLDLAGAARRFASGRWGMRVPVSGPREIAEVAAEFNRMADGLERSQAQQRALVADVAHELRTPLTVLRGYVEAIRDGLVEPDAQTIGLIHAEAVHLQHLVDDLQELAQAEASNLRLERESVAAQGLLSTAAAGFELQAEAKGIRLRLDLPDDLPTLLADRRRLTQVVHNLLANAIRYTPANGAVSLSARVAAERLRVEVTDTGPGIAQEHLARLFDRFYRVDASRARDTGGSGLGLTIARRLVEAHGGQIGLESVPGLGSTFWFELPLTGAPEPVSVGTAPVGD